MYHPFLSQSLSFPLFLVGIVTFVIYLQQQVICNHVADPRIVLKPNAGSDRSWVWNAFDFTEGQLEEVTFALRLGNSDSANEFNQVPTSKATAKLQHSHSIAIAELQQSTKNTCSRM